MQGEFVVLIKDKLVTFTNYRDIPQTFTNLVSFKPDYPPGPHTDKQHQEIENYNNFLNDLLRREDASSN